MMNAIVTGAGRGIGAAIAKKLSSDGINVALLDIEFEQVKKLADEIALSGKKAIGLKCDVGLTASTNEAVNGAVRELGDIDILVNNAGYGGPFHRIDEVSDAEWDSIIATNLKSVFLFSRKILPSMKTRRFGRIVNIASIQGMFGASQSSTYVAAKHGMIGYTRSIAAEWGEFGITCNAICPGYVDTAMGVKGREVEQYLEKVLQKSPVKRIASPDEIASMVSHLVGTQGGYINGAAIVMDGGITSHLGIT